MSKMRIEGPPSLEAYLGKNKDICIRQTNPGEADNVIAIPYLHAQKVINWLRILHGEHPPAPDKEFNAVDG